MGTGVRSGGLVTLDGYLRGAHLAAVDKMISLAIGVFGVYCTFQLFCAVFDFVTWNHQQKLLARKQGCALRGVSGSDSGSANTRSGH